MLKTKRTNLLKSNFTDEVSLCQEMNDATSGNVDDDNDDDKRNHS